MKSEKSVLLSFCYCKKTSFTFKNVSIKNIQNVSLLAIEVGRGGKRSNQREQDGKATNVEKNNTSGDLQIESKSKKPSQIVPEVASLCIVTENTKGH